MSVKNQQTTAREDIAIELAEQIREDWDWQINPRVIRWDDKPAIEVLCGTAVHTKDFHKYLDITLRDYPAEKRGMSGTGIVLDLGEDCNGEDMIILSEHYEISGDYETEEGEMVIHP